MNSVQRLYYWDTIRAFLMLLGVPYHVSLIYTAGVQDWSIVSPDTSVILGIFGSASHIFRMPIFFVVAGYFAASTLSRKAPGPWLQQRSLRLGVPLLASTVLLIPPLMFLYRLAAAVSQAPASTISELLPSVVASTKIALVTPNGNWTAHLWFLQALLIYSLMLAIFWKFRQHPSLVKLQAILEDFWKTRPMLTMAGFIVGIALYVIAAKTAVTVDRVHFNGVLLDRIVQLGKVLIYLPYFVIGALIFATSSWLDYFKRLSGVDIAITLAALTPYILIEAREESYLKVIAAFLAVVCAMYAGKILIALAYRYFNKASPFISEVVNASFTIYLFHFPLFCALSIPFFWLDLPALLEFAIITGLTLIISYLIHKVIERSSTLTLLFNGKPKKAPRNLKVAS